MSILNFKKLDINDVKMESNKLKEVDFDFDNISIDKKSYENILFYGISNQNFIKGVYKGSL